MASAGGKFKVIFDMSPKIEVSNQESYPGLRITPKFEDNMLAGMDIEVETEPSNDSDVIKDKAQNEIAALLERLRYENGMEINANITGIDRTGPPKLKQKGWVCDCERTVIVNIESRSCIKKVSSMPTEDMIKQQDEDMTYQLACYNNARFAKDTAEKIKNYYLVLEREQTITNNSYAPPTDLRHIRNAISHSKKLTDKNLLQYLSQELKSDKIDPTNPKHMRFLEQKMPHYEKEALRIIKTKHPHST